MPADEDRRPRSVRFEQHTLHELRSASEREAVVLIPIGAIEQHGPHLPVETDTLLATRVCEGAATRLDDVLVAPPVPWGLSNAHVGLGGTLSLRPTTMFALSIDIIESLIRSGFTRQIWVNGHASNDPALAMVVYEAKRLFGISIGALSYFSLGDDTFERLRKTPVGGTLHACEYETSLMLHVASGIADTDVAHYIEPLTEFDIADGSQPGVARIGYTFAERFPEGVAGDPRSASEATGREVFDACVAGLAEFVTAFRNVDLVNQPVEPDPVPRW